MCKVITAKYMTKQGTSSRAVRYRDTKNVSFIARFLFTKTKKIQSNSFSASTNVIRRVQELTGDKVTSLRWVSNQFFLPKNGPFDLKKKNYHKIFLETKFSKAQEIPNPNPLSRIDWNSRPHLTAFLILLFTSTSHSTQQSCRWSGLYFLCHSACIARANGR